ncbi:MAG: apolipoprotein N-acyltransferase, partial [Acidimicrobiales bacterium]
RALGLPAAIVLAEAARGAWPFGGLPMAGLALGQVNGPLAPSARVGGQLGLVALAGIGGVALAALVGRRWQVAGIAAALVAVATVTAGAAPDGGMPVDSIRVACVQGGGARGFRQADVDQGLVFEAQLAASRRLSPPIDLVVWPEDVLDVEGPVESTPEAAAVAAEARRLGATVVVGVIEGGPPGGFRNAAVAWGPTGEVVARYEKVHRVPFGEYIPGRAFFERLADLSDVPRDAIVGTGPGLLRTPAGGLGALISYEVFFPDRARAAVKAGGRLLLVPTNAASFRTSQVPTQEVAAARLRAIETGRDLLQASPTGASAVVDHRGRVLHQTTLGRRQVLRATVALRDGRTVYTVIGDGPLLALTAAALCAAWAAAGVRPSPRRRGSRTGH